MAQAQTRQERSASKDAVLPAEASRNEGGSALAGRNAATVSIADVSNGETLPGSGTDKEPTVRHWQDLIASSLALEEQARENDRWNARQSMPFLLGLSAALWALLIIGLLQAW